MKKCAHGCIFALITAGAMPGCNIKTTDTSEEHNRQFYIGLECKGPCNLDVDAKRDHKQKNNNEEANQ